MIYKGNKIQNRYFLGNKQVSSIYLGNTFIQGKEVDGHSSYVEIISTDFIDSNYDDNLHVHAEHNEIYHQGTSYYRFTIQASGDFTYTYNKKPSSIPEICT